MGTALELLSAHSPPRQRKLACYHGPGAAVDQQLFNLHEDPDELVNRAAEPEPRDRA